MGFPSNAQGRAAHEALLARQDAELRLLDTMRRCITNKIKCDREYALALSAAAGQGLKFDRSEELATSQIVDVWKTMIEEMDKTGRLIRQNAESLESKTLDRLNSMYQEKRKARKYYQEEHNRITQQFTHLVNDVNRKKSEYQKYLEHYKVTRARFEEHYVKCGRGGRKLDDVTDKYQKACRKLHLTHNEYVLLLCEASEFEKDFRLMLLPELLEFQQVIQEAFVVSWQKVLQDVSNLSNLTSKEFRESQQNVEVKLNSIKPADEYKQLIEKHEANRTTPVTFFFDDCLVEDTSGKLLANKLTVDNLTVDWLRNKQSELETGVRDYQDKRAHLMTENKNGLHDSNKKEHLELLCIERKMAKQLELIKTALNDLGCEEVPSGCDLSLIDHQAITENGTDANNQGVGERGSQSSLSVRKRFLATMFRKPFRRKSVPSSPVAPVPNSTSPSSNSINNSDQTRTLVDEEWFHGVLPREEVVRLLTQPGDFLVRQTTRNDECQTVLSVCWDGHKHFIVQTTAEGQFRFEGPEFPSIQELIWHQHKSGLPVTSKSGAILRKAIFRERWELNNDDVILLDKIGRGNFGDVYKAKLKTNGSEVAVKTCRVALPDEHKKKFLQEGRILKQYDHPNIVKLIGICVQKQPIMIVMELVPGGSLLTYLRKRAENLTQVQLMGMCKDAAAGMRYLESKNCIHRDLAARNCLVTDNNSVKISDFGMSREEEEYIVSDGMKQIPIKWTAPEALNFGKYTSLCDVWSYGVLIWEIFSRGSTPYNGMSNSKARDKIDAGYRMPAPEGTPDEMYHLMLNCWEYKSDDRPNFKQIYSVVDTLSGALQ